jgi:hypothetical protein
MIKALTRLELILIRIAKGEHFTTKSSNCRYYVGIIPQLGKRIVEERVYIHRNVTGSTRVLLENVRLTDIEYVEHLCENAEEIIQLFEIKMKHIKERKEREEKNNELRKLKKNENKIRSEEMSKCCVRKLRDLGYDINGIKEEK